ncbi:laminin subunit beta-1 isoform X2 [Folsomia candida]|uniref:laminin subunit beta-1 isoform X2 n=1 Tax=Folsomia candida TaxID=158441 RepID=UPI000B8FA10D|nr:laminin subunit beta-1 isoform X2 [Folsomia candida]
MALSSSSHFYRNQTTYSIFIILTLGFIFVSGQEPQSHEFNGYRRPPQRGYGQRSNPCDQGSCYPATGNLLIGREKRLTATSTCGLRREERYCIVSHLEDKKKCFRCDSRNHTVRNPILNHRVEHVVHRFAPGTQQRSWWQSENGVENVSIELALEAEFHFTHLIITFKTFRPAAMLIERSFDEGKTWRVYRYFAYDCDDSFPGVSKAPQNNITDVICESRYSAVAPSTEGEIIYRVLQRVADIKDPYAPEIQNLLKMTNLRINLTRLHTLGDDLLDKRTDIQEKYYYAIYDIIVRGSCSCYGHASRCLPLEGVEDRTDMVHGRCECTHNTKGLNCEKCEDFYWDLPWKPAIGKETNACKRCNCNNHAASCHFDNAVFEASGRVSGGVCDNCQHNTVGHKCDQCKTFFYLASDRKIDDEDACIPCDCDDRGSLDTGICDSRSDTENGLTAGNCHCKEHVVGRRCDQCQPGFWNLTEESIVGCESCTCNLLGTVGNQGCNMVTGECTCKRYVTGRDCNQCLPEYWGLSDERDGCKPCDCDIGGAYDNFCDVISGQCRCRPHVAGRNCSQPEQGYFAGHLDFKVYEAETARTPNSPIVIREPYRDGRDSTWSGPGFVRANEDSFIEFDVTDLTTTMEYDLVIRYEPQQPGWQDVNVLVLPQDELDQEGPCFGAQYQTGPTRVSLNSDAREALMYVPLCLEANKHYKIRLDFTPSSEKPQTSILIDSIVLMPKTDKLPFFMGTQMNDYRRQLFDSYRCGSSFASASRYPVPEECKRLLYSVGYAVYDGAFECSCDPTGSTSAICDSLGGQCSCKLNVVGRTCDKCAAGTYGFGPEGCKPCECNPIGSLDNFCDIQSGQCRCIPNAYGVQCGQCQPGYWNFPNCQQCNCNGHADTCESETGTCTSCRDNTTGTTCDRCVEGHYGDPRLGIDIPCRACPCPGTMDSGHSFASRCALDRLTNDVICECQEGYQGPRCDACADNYFGNPDVPGGQCRPCSCNNNIDIARPGNCDLKTGECIQCLFNTEGFTCESCKAGFYGDAVNQMCRSCVCDILGTNATSWPCDRSTGQCPCLPNVIGVSCDQCEDNHWKIASGEGCEPCDCDPIGSRSSQCNLYHGQCECKPGFGGRKCDQCQADYWGNPNVECYPCQCNEWGSSTSQCDRVNGSCVCHPGIGGAKCDECARGYIGSAPSCSPCGECFENWDRIIGNLKTQTTKVVDAASQIKQQGATGAYTKEFDSMKNRVDEVKRLLESSSISSTDLDTLGSMISEKKAVFGNTSVELDEVEALLTNISQRILSTNVSLDALERKVDALQSSADSLRNTSINLQEANVEGALNITRDAKRRSDDAVRRANDVQKALSDSERQRRRIEALLNQIGPQMNRTQEEVADTLKKLDGNMANITTAFPALNTLVCDRAGDPCDSHCGGAGCGKCGGLSCEGAVTNADNALKYAQDAFTELKRKDADAEDLLRTVTQTKLDVDEAKDLAQTVFNEVSKAKNVSEKAKTSLEDMEDEIKKFLDILANTPEEIRTLASDVLAQNISLKPEQIDELAAGIQESINSLTDIDEIIRLTHGDLRTAETLKNHADKAAGEANKVLQEAIHVRDELKKTKDAQKSAEAAIDEARGHITAADTDLKQIGSETTAADKTASESLMEIEQLKRRLEELQRKNLQNERRRDQAKNESESALQNATVVQENAATLKSEYDRVKKTLQAKLALFAGAEQKDGLQNRANRLANNVSDKLKELQEMEREYIEHERRSDDLAREIDSLSRQMEEHLRAIRQIEEYHRTCNS